MTPTVQGGDYPHVTPQMWRDGERYVSILCHRFLLRVPRWVDRDGLESAARLALVLAARAYRPERGAWTTLLHRAAAQQFAREVNAQLNWHRSRPPFAVWDGQSTWPRSLDEYVLDDATLLDQIPDERYEPERLAVEADEDTRRRRRVHAALAQLDDVSRALVVRRHVDRKTWRDLGDEMGVSRTTAMTRTREAGAKLRALLEIAR